MKSVKSEFRSSNVKNFNKVVSEQVDPVYREYLMQLRDRNRIRFLIQRRSRESIRRIRLEQGFNLYLNLPLPNEVTDHQIGCEKVAHSARGPKLSHVSLFSDCPDGRTKRTTSAPVKGKRPQRRKVWGEMFMPSSNDECKVQERSFHSPAVFPTPMEVVTPQLNSLCLQDAPVIFDQPRLDSSELMSLHRISFTFDVLSNLGDEREVCVEAIQLSIDERSMIPLQADGIRCTLLCNSEEEGPELYCPGVQKILTTLSNTTDAASVWSTSVHNIPFRLHAHFAVSKRQGSAIQNVFLSIANPSVPSKKKAGIGLFRVNLTLPYSSKVTVFHGEAKKADDGGVIIFTIPINGSSNIPLNETPAKQQSDICNTTTHSENLVQPISGKSRYTDPFSSWFDDIQSGRCGVALDIEKPDLMQPSRMEIIRKNILTTGRALLNSLLEESWNSLEFFDHFHAGRIASGLDYFPAESCERFTVNKSGICDKAEKVEDTPSESNECVLTHTKDGDISAFLSKIPYPARPFNLDICIPELPEGRTLIFDIVNTWGDAYYVGLTGIEVFTSDGTNITSFCQISAEPSDINILPEYGHDPRVVENLIDGINWTRDDTHMWLAPYTAGARHIIELTLPAWSSPVALVRIWNYNKSRVHTSRGARDVIIYLDVNPIFMGEIRKASGLESGELEDFSETILFTTDDAILEKVAQNDSAIQCQGAQMVEISLEEPTTCPLLEDKEKTVHNFDNSVTSDIRINKALKRLSLSCNEKVDYIEITLLDTWIKGAQRIGLTGLEILDKNQEPIPIQEIRLCKADELDPLPLNRLFGPQMETDKTEEMWSCTFTPDSPPKLCVKLPPKSDAHSICLWNYNDRRLGKDYGVKLIKLTDNLGNNFCHRSKGGVMLVRRAPGHTEYPFGQLLHLKKDSFLTRIITAPSVNLYSDNILPYGFVYQVKIYSSWYDPHYVGLNRLELLSITGSSIAKEQFSIYASPDPMISVDHNTKICKIVRKVNNSVSDANSGSNVENHSWFIPLLPDKLPTIHIIFNEPVLLVGMRIWNCTSIVGRGVRDFAVLIDERSVFCGRLPMARPKVYQTSECPSSDSTTCGGTQQTENGLLQCSLGYVHGHPMPYVVPFDIDRIKLLGIDNGLILQATKPAELTDILPVSDSAEPTTYVTDQETFLEKSGLHLFCSAAHSVRSEKRVSECIS
ncbi:unnamed protein product [Dicrocoelium dendriticum]|nr:unnamed protein product [Dicrocoelium dendriticum]